MQEVKMSLCHIRLYLVSALLVLTVDTGVKSFTLRRTYNATRDPSQDITPDESVMLELKKDIKSPNDIEKSYEYKSSTELTLTEFIKSTDKVFDGHSSTEKSYTTNQSKETIETTNFIKIEENKTITENIFQEDTTTVDVANVETTPRYEDTSLHTTTGNEIENIITITDNNKDQNDNIMTLRTETPTTESDSETETNYMVTTDLTHEKRTDEEIQTNDPTESSTSSTTEQLEDFNLYKTMSLNGKTLNEPARPPLKKYISIDRKHNNSTTEIPTTTASEEMVISETGHSLPPLSNVIVSDGSSSDQPKYDPVFFTTNEVQSQSPMPPVGFDPPNKITTLHEGTKELMHSSESTEMTSKTTKLGKFEAIRGGYLDFSDKSTTENVHDTSGYNMNDKYRLRAIFDVDAQDSEMVDDKVNKETGSQSQLTDDAIKEELLKEEILNNHEENAIRYRHSKSDEYITNSAPTDTENKTESTLLIPFHSQNDTSEEDILSVMPISTERTKHTKLYPVNPNYKPLKKIDVQPPKQYVRDPDDNSWRNESLSSLGIVFKANNSSKPFTQVLKNKTEREWNTILEKNNRNESPDLRERLERIAERRKSKKKKIDSLGNVVYSDYDESQSSSLEDNTTKDKTSSPVIEKDNNTTETPKLQTELSSSIPLTSSEEIKNPKQSSPPFVFEYIPTTANTHTTMPPTTTVNNEILQSTTVIPPTTLLESLTNQAIEHKTDERTTKKPKKFLNIFDYEDTTDDDDLEYLNLAKIDLKRFTMPTQTTNTASTPMSTTNTYLNPLTTLNFLPDRKGTIQYFPPRTTQKLRSGSRRNKANYFKTELPQNVLPVSFTQLTTLPVQFHKNIPNKISDTQKQTDFTRPYSKMQFNHNIFVTPPIPHNDFVVENDEIPFIIRDFGDFLNVAAKDVDYDAKVGFIPYTDSPIPGITVNELVKNDKEKEKTQPEEYDYEAQFRKDVIERFVDNFNQNTNRFKSDFPIVYNNSIVHRDILEAGKGGIASSRAFYRRLYGTNDPEEPQSEGSQPRKAKQDPNCDNVTVELSPAYELHYYVPEQEEKEEAEQKPGSPYRYKL